MEKCPICDRELGDVINEHHLIPKCEKGKDKFKLHIVCHKKIHSVFTEHELRDYYHTWERLKSHTEIEKFIKWVQKRPIDYNDSSREHSRRKRK